MMEGSHLRDGTVDLTPDCNQCAALCCVFLAFDEGESFGFDKAAGEPCRNLSRHACTIHADLATTGFKGCVHFDCQGAGQRVVQEVFAGRSWRDQPELAAPMEAAFRAMRRLHEDYALLTAAPRLFLTAQEEALRTNLLSALAAQSPQTEASLAAYKSGPLPRAVKDYLATLRQRLAPVGM